MGDWDSHPLNKAELPKSPGSLFLRSGPQEGMKRGRSQGWPQFWFRSWPETEFRRKTAQRREGACWVISTQCPQTGRRHANLLLENETRYKDRAWIEGREAPRFDCCWLPWFVFSFSSTLRKTLPHIHVFTSGCSRGCRLASHVPIPSVGMGLRGWKLRWALTQDSTPTMGPH